MHQSNPRYLLDKTKDELYSITNDFNGPDSKVQIVRAIWDSLSMDNISENLDDLGMLSYTLLWTTQIKDAPKTAITMIRAIMQAINGVQEQLKVQDMTMEFPIDNLWTVLQAHMTTIKEKLGLLTNIIGILY